MSALPPDASAAPRSADLQPPQGGKYAPVPLEQLRELEGIELFRGIMRGELPGAPIAELMNMWIHEAEPGRVVFAGRPEMKHYNPIGSVHGG